MKEPVIKIRDRQWLDKLNYCCDIVRLRAVIVLHITSVSQSPRCHHQGFERRLCGRQRYTSLGKALLLLGSA